jgi:hypothetical protein
VSVSSTLAWSLGCESTRVDISLLPRSEGILNNKSEMTASKNLYTVPTKLRKDSGSLFPRWRGVSHVLSLFDFRSSPTEEPKLKDHLLSNLHFNCKKTNMSSIY